MSKIYWIRTIASWCSPGKALRSRIRNFWLIQKISFLARENPKKTSTNWTILNKPYKMVFFLVVSKARNKIFWNRQKFLILLLKASSIRGAPKFQSALPSQFLHYRKKYFAWVIFLHKSTIFWLEPKFSMVGRFNAHLVYLLFCLSVFNLPSSLQGSVSKEVTVSKSSNSIR